MKCTYNYKGNAFNSELALNNYLLTTESLKPILGDIVFQLSEKQRNYAEKLHQAEVQYKDIRDNGYQLNSVRVDEVEPEDLDDIGHFKYPFISVTDLIHTMPGRYTNQVFPIFRSEEYWKEKFIEYKGSGVTNPYELQFISDLVEPGKPISEESILNAIRDRFEGEMINGLRTGGLWKQQAMCGNMIHEMFSLFYRQRIRENGPFLYRCQPQEVINWFNKNIDPKYKDYISKDIIESTVKQCFQLDSEIRQDKNFGPNAYIRAEQPITSKLDLTLPDGKVSNVIGKIDLLVIGENGKTGIIDYKCSPKNYTNLNMDNDPNYYNSAKILTFKYQLATYRRILNFMGINPNQLDLFIVPLKFENFKMEDGKVSFSHISSLGDQGGGTMLQKLSNSDFGDERTNIESNLAQMFPKDLYIPKLDDVENIYEDVQETMKRQFPIQEKDTSEKGIIEFINERGVKKNKSTGNWEFRPYKGSDRGIKIIDGKKTKEEAVVEIKESIQKENEFKKNYNIETAQGIRKAYIEYYNGDGEDPIDKIEKLAFKKSSSKSKPDYLKKQFEKYSNSAIYELISDEKLDKILDQYGILLFRNKASGLIDVIKISNLYNPEIKQKLGKGKYLLGTFLKDDLAHGSADSLTMESTLGNIELMETMHVLNRLHGVFNDENVGIGSVKLLCPGPQTGLEVSNEQLLYNFDRLNNLDKDFKNNHFYSTRNTKGDIKMVKFVDIVKQDAKEIILGVNTKRGLDTLAKEIKDSISTFPDDIRGKTKEQIKEKLLELDKNLVDHYNYVQQNIKEGQIESPEALLHRDLLFAIAELSGVKMIQQTEGHKTIDFRNGISGTLIDNPGTLQSYILNQATEQVTIAYQNVRDTVVNFDKILRNKLEVLKKSKGWGWSNQNLTGNQVSDLYYNMYDHESGDIRFVNPWDMNSSLTDEEREFLKFALIKINTTRDNKLDIKEFQRNPDLMGELINKDSDMLLVPLMKGDFASEVATRGGIKNFIEDRFRFLRLWDPEIRAELKEKVDNKVTNLLSGDNKTQDINNGNQWEAINTMHTLDTNIEVRRDKIGRLGTNYFEHNLETILLKQHSAYSMQKELNKVFPIIQALAIHLNLQGAILNSKFDEDLNYLFNYIKTKIHNQPFENREGTEALLKDVTDEMMKWASRLSLAFNPKQAYQFIDGLWKDIMLFIKQPDGTLAFSKENLTAAWKFAMSDLFHIGDKLSLQQTLNMQYGMNDMDMNVFIDRIKTDNTGLFTHFWDTGFRFASRPDYYNRMTIFVAQMKADGCFDAHIQKDGQWIYDWTKDKRFDEFARARGDIGKAKDIEKFKKQRSEYIAVARQLVEEGAYNFDGTLFEFDLNNPKPLPKAYTNKQSESMKALADRIYGYYSHEKKSMIHSMWAGALIMQMNTFWSAKKNQYAQTRSYTQEGYLTDYEEDGVKWYWKLNEEGNLEPTTEVTDLPIKVWKGRPQEGILVTLCTMAMAAAGRSPYTDKAGWQGMKSVFENVEPDVARLYSANLRQFIVDLIGMWILGMFIGGSLLNWQKEFQKNNPNKTFSNAMANTGIGLFVGMWDQSTDDFNGIKSIMRIQDRGPSITPFAFSSLYRVHENFKKTFIGNQDFYDAIVNTSSAGRSSKPAWDWVKLELLGRHIGDNGTKTA